MVTIEDIELGEYSLATAEELTDDAAVAEDFVYNRLPASIHAYYEASPYLEISLPDGRQYYVFIQDYEDDNLHTHKVVFKAIN